jgi:periplasmic copper chaperone A
LCPAEPANAASATRVFQHAVAEIFVIARPIAAELIHRYAIHEDIAMYRIMLVAALVLTAAGTVNAQVKISNAWVRATVPQQKATGAFMTLTAAKGARLLEASSPIAGLVEIHEMKMENQVMRMRAVPVIELPAGKPVDFGPGSYHVMLMDLRRQVKAGETVPITLVIEDADKKRATLQVQAAVRPLTSAAGKNQAH